MLNNLYRLWRMALKTVTNQRQLDIELADLQRQLAEVKEQFEHAKEQFQGDMRHIQILCGERVVFEARDAHRRKINFAGCLPTRLRTEFDNDALVLRITFAEDDRITCRRAEDEGDHEVIVVEPDEVDELLDLLTNGGAADAHSPQSQRCACLPIPFADAAFAAVEALIVLRESLPPRDYCFGGYDAEFLGNIHQELAFTLAFVESLSAAWAGDSLVNAERISAAAHEQGWREATGQKQ